MTELKAIKIQIFAKKNEEKVFWDDAYLALRSGGVWQSFSKTAQLLANGLLAVAPLTTPFV